MGFEIHQIHCVSSFFTDTLQIHSQIHNLYGSYVNMEVYIEVTEAGAAGDKWVGGRLMLSDGIAMRRVK